MLDQNLSDFMKKIENTVYDITQSQSVNDLKRSIDSTIRDVKSVVRTSANAFSSGNGSGTSAPYQPATYSTSANSSKQSETKQKNASNRDRERLTVSNELAIPVSQVPGRISGALLLICGISGIILSSIIALVSLFSMIVSGSSPVTTLVSLLFLIISICITVRGGSLSARVSRYRKYRRELSGVTFSSIKVLAASVQKSTEYVVKDLQKMIQSRFFPEGHLDAEKTTFILDHETYQQYLTLEQRIKAEKAQQDERAANPELNALIQEGNVCIQKIREANDAIPGEIISEKLNRLETVVTRIYEFVDKHPERVKDIRRFTSYYLPTTLKLVTAYREFDAQEIQGETVQSSKQEIEETLDMINQAFETMLDGLYEPDTRDLSADISVLQTMLKQEGLTDHDFADQSESK